MNRGCALDSDSFFENGIESEGERTMGLTTLDGRGPVVADETVLKHAGNQVS
jgi:hypothetical protein